MTVRRRVQIGADPQSHMAQGFGERTVDVAASRTVDRNRRAARSQELIEAVTQLDATMDAATARAIMQWINDEYENRRGGVLVGLFCRCHLGQPYVDHRLDFLGGCILEHYTGEQEPPGLFRAARPLARNDAYSFIEVYDDGAIVPVRADGRPVL